MSRSILERRSGRPAMPGLAVARVADMTLAVAGVTAFVASLPTAYRRVATLDPAVTWHAAAIRSGLIAWGVSTGVYATVWVTVLAAITAVFVGVGVLIVVRRPSDPAALLFAAILIVFGTIWPNTVPPPGWPPALSVPTEVLVDIGFIGFFGLLFYFPDARFVPQWTRWLFALLAAHVLISEGLLRAGTELPVLLDLLLVLVWAGAGVWSQIHRYRHVSTCTQRQQSKWVAAALIIAMTGFAALSAVGNLPVFNEPRGAVVFAAMELSVYGGLFCLVPLAVARAVLRHRLWDIDPLLNRAVVYGGLTVGLTGTYAVVVWWVGHLVTVDGFPLASFAAAGVVAVLCEPLRRHLQRWANRMTYGQRDDPYAALSALGRQLENATATDAVLPTLVTSVRAAMRSPYAAVVAADGTILADSGAARPAAVTVPLVQHGDHIGTLAVAPRAPGEPFDARDQRLLTDLARQAAAALHAVQLHGRTVRLAAELQTSRERLVTAREEERRRLRRELHDGLGPTLAAQAMQIEAAHDLLRIRPRDAQTLLADVLATSTSAVDEIRRIARGLRPPALDDLGLLGAVRQVAGQLAPGVRVLVEGGALPSLPAAVEVAAYAIVREALTNVVRHAHASTATVELNVTGTTLHLRVRDDGRGLVAGPVAGVGTLSMRERAHELGGTCVVATDAGGGTLVTVDLPVSTEGDGRWTRSES